MTDVKIIQPQEMGTDFTFDSSLGKWKLSSPKASTDANNSLTTGSDSGLFLDKSAIKQYRIIQDNAARKIRLYTHLADVGFDPSTATLVDEVDLVTLDAVIDDVSIAGGILTFTDAETSTQLVFDTNSPIYQVLTANSYAISVTGDGKVSQLTIDLIVNPDTDNLLKITASGAIVDKNDILALLNSSGVGTVDFSFVKNISSENLELTINGTTQYLPMNRVLNSANEIIGYMLSGS